MKTVATYLFIGIFFLTGCVREPEFHPDDRLVIYPNPASGYANVDIKNPTAESFRVRAFDAKGHAILDQTSSSTHRIFELRLENKGYFTVYVDIEGTVIRKELISL